MAVEHRIALVPAIPSVEWIMRQNQSDPIPYVLFLVVLYLHELISEVIVMKELVVMVAKNEMLLTLQVLQQPNCGLCVIAGQVPENEHMIVVLHYAIPIVHHAVVVVLRPIELVVGEGQLILRPPYWICVSLIPKVNVRDVEVVGHHQKCHAPLCVFTIIPQEASGNHRPNLSRIHPDTLGIPVRRRRISRAKADIRSSCIIQRPLYSKAKVKVQNHC